MDLGEFLNNIVIDKSLDLKIKTLGPTNDVGYIATRFNFYKKFDIVGTMTLEEYGHIVNIDVFWINRDYRHLKFGHKILKKIIMLLTPEHLITLTAFPLDNNISLEKLVNFYEQIGFKQIGEPVENSVYMEYEN